MTTVTRGLQPPTSGLLAVPLTRQQLAYLLRLLEWRALATMPVGLGKLDEHNDAVLDLLRDVRRMERESEAMYQGYASGMTNVAVWLSGILRSYLGADVDGTGGEKGGQ